MSGFLVKLYNEAYGEEEKVNYSISIQNYVYFIFFEKSVYLTIKKTMVLKMLLSRCCPSINGIQTVDGFEIFLRVFAKK